MSDITANIAHIGGGKSLWGNILCLRELEHSERFVVTDIPVIFSNPPAGAPNTWWTYPDYFHQFVKAPVIVTDRMAVLNEDQAREFWRYLPLGYFAKVHGEKLVEILKEYGCEIVENEWPHGSCRMIKLPNKPHALFKNVPDFRFRTVIPENRVGCHYVIDEAHKKFPPMHYQQVGPQAEWYMSELRKLNDDLDWITQHPDKVDKNFRRNITQTMCFENMSKTRLFAGVTLPGRFRWHWYNQSEIPTRIDKPTASGWFHLDSKRRYHYLYKTMDGTGVAGGMLKETGRKGRHWSIWILAVVVILIGAYILPRALEKMVTQAVSAGAGSFERGMRKGIEKSGIVAPPPAAPAAAPQTSAPAVALPVTRRNFPPGSVRGPVSVSSADPVQDIAPRSGPGGDLYCTGFVVDGTNVTVTLSDGEIAYSEYGEVQAWGRRYVKVFGLPAMEVRHYVGTGEAPPEFGPGGRNQVGPLSRR